MTLNEQIEKATAEMDAAQGRYSAHRYSDPVAAEQDATEYYEAKRRLLALEAKADG